MITTTEDYRPREFRNWLLRDGILRLRHDRHYLFGLSWEALAICDPDCGCRSFEVTLCLVPTIVFTYQWFWDDPRCPDAARGDGGED